MGLKVCDQDLVVCDQDLVVRTVLLELLYCIMSSTNPVKVQVIVQPSAR